MSENFETALLDIHKRIAKKLENLPYKACIEDDGAGPYIQLWTPNTSNEDEDYRCLSLDDPDNPEVNLATYRWQFWNHNWNVYLTSELGANANEEEVLDFLNQGLSEEKK